jgi:hypothetical protein
VTSKYNNIPRLEPFGKSQLDNKYPRKGNEVALNDLKDQIATILSQESTDSRKVNDILYLVEESLWLGQIVAKEEIKAQNREVSVQLGASDFGPFLKWIANPNGDFCTERLTVRSGGGSTIFYVKPYSYKEQQGEREWGS